MVIFRSIPHPPSRVTGDRLVPQIYDRSKIGVFRRRLKVSTGFRKETEPRLCSDGGLDQSLVPPHFRKETEAGGALFPATS
jgi:hypothetical protein